jgi:predicted porin
LTLGRQYDPLIDLVQGITADNYFGSVFATAGDVDNYDNSFRINNSIKYVSPTYAGFQVEAMYAFGGVAGQTGSGQTWSVGAAYNNGPIGVAASYLVVDNTSSLTAGKRTGWGGTSDGPFDTFNTGATTVNAAYATAKSINIARAAAQYTIGALTFGASYSNAQYKSDGYSLFATEKYNTGNAFATYQLTPALLLGLGYTYTAGSGDTKTRAARSATSTARSRPPSHRSARMATTARPAKRSSAWACATSSDDALSSPK